MSHCSPLAASILSSATRAAVPPNTTAQTMSHVVSFRGTTLGMKGPYFSEIGNGGGLCALR